MVYAITTYLSLLAAVAVVWAVLLVPVGLFVLIDEAFQQFLAAVPRFGHAEQPAKHAVEPVGH